MRLELLVLLAIALSPHKNRWESGEIPVSREGNPPFFNKADSHLFKSLRQQVANIRGQLKLLFNLNMLYWDWLLDLSHSRLTNGDLRSVLLSFCRNSGDLDRLYSLDVSHSNIDDAGLSYFEDCESLRILRVGNTCISAKGVEAIIRKHKRVRQLGLSGLNITRDALREIGDLTLLENLDLSNTGVTNRDLEELRRLLPDTKIIPLREE
jgi:Leucine-rich repeat (LRR) protein